MLIFIVFFNFLFAIISVSAFLMLENSADFLLPIHNACRSHLTGYEHALLYQALMCGAKYTDPNITDPLHRIGMGMILTSTGSHLLFLEICLHSVVTLKKHAARPHRRILVWLAMTFFALVNLLNPILMRVALKMLLRDLNFNLKLGWTRVQTVTAAGLCALPFCLSDGAINGLLVGWIASLAATGFFQPQREHNLWQRPLFQLRVYLLILPALIPYSVPHPVSLLAHIFLFPAAGIILMACALSLTLIPALSPLIDSIISGLFFLLAKTAPYFPLGTSPHPVPMLFLVAYLSTLTIWAWQLERPPKCTRSLSF